MIFKEHVRAVAEKYLNSQLKELASARIHLLAPHRFDRWVDLLWVRLNELEVAGYVKSQGAINHFIMQATSVYGLKQLDRAEIKVPLENEHA